MKLGDVVTVMHGSTPRIAHVTDVSMLAHPAPFISAAATGMWRRGKTFSWSGTLPMSDEGRTWIRGSHASKGKPTTAAGRALVTAYALASTSSPS